MYTHPTVADPIRILLIDDHPIVRQGLVSLLDTQDDFEVVGEGETVRDATRLYNEKRPDVAVIDMRLADGQAVEVIRELKVWDASARCVVLSTYDDESDVVRAFAAGAHAYLLKSGNTQLIIDTVRKVAAGQRSMPNWVAQRLATERQPTDLTTREREILRLLAGGGSNRELAKTLGITPETVKTHLNSIRAKLEAKDRAAAVAIALRRGLI